MTLNEINIGDITIIESVRKVNEYKSLINNMQMYTLMTYPALFVGILLIAWKSFTFDFKSILGMAGIFVFELAFGIKKFKMHQTKIGSIEKEILDLNEYAK